jgi:hypothetical protein
LQRLIIKYPNSNQIVSEKEIVTECNKNYGVGYDKRDFGRALAMLNPSECAGYRFLSLIAEISTKFMCNKEIGYT